MSLSQKFEGLMLVPWYNSDEWKFIYHLVYFENNKDNQLKALELLKVWKLRTPILSAGVEGTLIVLEALLLNTESLSSEQVANQYAIALMRFLNLCAANSEKQGAFTRTSTKNEVPKWLINLRHDIAHGHQIPSLFNLKMGLDFGFNWLKEKYWEPQSKLMQDYIVGGLNNCDHQFANPLNAYIDVTMALYENRDLNNAYLDQINSVIRKRAGKTMAHPYLMLDVLLEMISQSLENMSNLDDRCLEKLLSQEAMLKPNFDVDVEQSGNAKIDNNFRNSWNNLLNLLHKYGLLILIVEKLFNITGDISQTAEARTMAALWINEIIGALIENSEDTNKTSHETLKLDSNKFTYKEEVEKLESKVLLFSANEFSKKYINFFLDDLLKYVNKDRNDEVKQELEVLFQANSQEDLHCELSHIHLSDDLPLGSEAESLVANDEGSNGETHGPGKPIIASSKWQKITDTSVFKKCPLGVLPHQIGRLHPFLITG